MKIAILSNINLDSLAKRVKNNLKVYVPSGYGNWVRELIDSRSGLFLFKPDNVFIILDGEELVRAGTSFMAAKKEMRSYISYIQKALRSWPDVNFFLSNLDYPLKKIQTIQSMRQERQLEYFWLNLQNKLNRQNDNCYTFDLKRLIEMLGREQFYSSKLWYLGGMKFSMTAEKILAEEINYYISAVSQKRKKCLILDLDNTLWGGIVGEEGVSGIELSDNKEGARYKDFQKRLKEFKKIGVILAIASKNNIQDVVEVFNKHKNMVLVLDDFVIKKINWKTKSENIAEIADELNLGLDSFVLIDDNPAERAQVKAALPEVEVPDFPKDTANLESFAQDIQKKFFPALTVTNEDKKKTIMYKQEARRAKAKNSARSVDDFLKSLKMEIHFWKAKKEDIGRIAQLTQKTNQFNLTSKRYSEAQINQFRQSKNYRVYLASLTDKFGDNGKICVLIVKKLSSHAVILDTFLLSCRVMGRFIEDQIISYVEKKIRREGFKKIIGEYRPTSKNTPVKNLFKRLGYRLVSGKAKNEKYELILSNSGPSARKSFAKFYQE